MSAFYAAFLSVPVLRKLGESIVPRCRCFGYIHFFLRLLCWWGGVEWGRVKRDAFGMAPWPASVCCHHCVVGVLAISPGYTIMFLPAHAEVHAVFLLVHLVARSPSNWPKIVGRRVTWLLQQGSCALSCMGTPFLFSLFFFLTVPHQL